jgi:GxxExxY protein
MAARQTRITSYINAFEKISAPQCLCGKKKTKCHRGKTKAPSGENMTENQIGTQVLETAITVHRELGPGLLETVYEVVLASELNGQGLRVERQVPVPITYKGIRFNEGFRADLVVEGKVILELKSVEKVSPAHKKQVQTYLRLTGCKLGYLLNFGEEVLRTGITRCVNGLKEAPAE